MAYKNFFLRLLFSLIFLTIYLICIYVNFSLIFYLIIIIYILILFEIYIYFKKYKFYPIIYILLSFSFLITIKFDDKIILYFNLYILTVIVFDIFSYLVGKFFGKYKLIKISPNKTIEGFIGGVLFSLFSALLFVYNTQIIFTLNLIFYIILFILSTFIGDIIESYFKRKNDLKNSSKLIPGHGGIFDRFDSFLFSIIFYSIFINFYL